MPDIPPEHIDALARVMGDHIGYGLDAFDPHSWRCRDKDRYPGPCDCGPALAIDILTSTDPAVLDALTDALVRAGRLRKEESEYCTCGHYLTYHSGDGCWFTTTFTQRCICTLMRPQNHRLVTGWREGT